MRHAILYLALAAFFTLSDCQSLLVSPQLDQCSPDYCELPDCLCSDLSIPSGLSASDTPQIVVLSINGGNTVITTDLYQEIFNGQRKNPNGQTISATFFINHEYNDYSLSHQYWREGHEIALNTITKTSSTSYWANLDEEGWRKELGDQREQLAYFAKIPIDDIQGVRSPYLVPVTDAMYNASRKAGLRYDSSRPTLRPQNLFWPYTADYQSLQGCVTCLEESHPGFWISPLVSLTGSNNNLCSTVDACLDPPKDVDEAYNLLYNNFLNHSLTNRAPFGVHVNVGWLTNVETPWIKEGYMKFIDKVLSLGDTYIVSISKALDWVQEPKTLTSVDDIPSWRPSAVKPNGCGFPFTCTFTGSQLPPGMSGGSRIMKSCQVVCPPKYPWLDNPLGRN